jgi:hypothetical protein
LLSTAHAPLNEDGSIPTCQRKDGRKKVDVPCPPLLLDYITNMRGVDRGDQMIALYNSRRKSVKAWKSMLWYMLECAILNAFIIEGHFDQRHHLQPGTRRDFMAFRIDLANRLIDGFTQRKANPRKDHSIERLNPALDHLPATGPPVRCYLCQRRKVFLT